MKLNTNTHRRQVLTISALMTLVGTPPTIQASEVATIPPGVMIADPNPPAIPIRIPAPSPVNIDGVTRVTTPTAQFSIDYAAAGESDFNGQTCVTFPESAKAAYQAAADIWAATIRSTVPIRIKTCWASLHDRQVLGYAGAGHIYRDFPNATKTNTWYVESLANALSNTDQGAAHYDMHITYNGNFSWYYGTDGNTTADQYDLMSVVLHEIGHGLNLAGSASYSAGGEGMYGYDNNRYPNIYDTFVKDGNGVSLLDSGTYVNPSLALGAALTSNNLWFHGSSAVAANGNQPVKLYAPYQWKPGSSFSHLDYDTFSGTNNSNSNRLMVYALAAGSSIHDPGDVTRGLLHDLGWSVNSICNASTATETSSTFAIANNQWTMFGLPLNTSNNQVGQIFDELDTAMYGRKWVVYEVDNTQQKYTKLTTTSPLTSGKAYWILTLNGAVNVTMQGVPVALDNSCHFEIPLHATGYKNGENAIGNPYKSAIEWSSVQVKTDSTYSTLGTASSSNILNETFTRGPSGTGKSGATGYSYATAQTSGQINPWEAIWVKTKPSFASGTALAIRAP